MKLRVLVAMVVLAGVFVVGRLYRGLKQAARVLRKPEQPQPPERTVEREGNVYRIRWGRR